MNIRNYIYFSFALFMFIDHKRRSSHFFPNSGWGQRASGASDFKLGILHIIKVLNLILLFSLPMTKVFAHPNISIVIVLK